jgi:hypothetical protein
MYISDTEILRVIMCKVCQKTLQFIVLLEAIKRQK